MCFYYYAVEVYDVDNHKVFTENGYTVGVDYRNALNNLIEYYTEASLVSLTLEYVADKPILILPSGDAVNRKGLIAAIKDNNNI